MSIRRAAILGLLVEVIFPLAIAQTPPAVTTLTTGTKLVIVDVVVADSRQNPIHNLTASDFSVFENGAPERIKTFEEHSASTAKAEPPLNLPPGTFTNYTAAPANAALNILLLDTLNTPLTDQTYVHNQLRLFLKNNPPNAPLAIFGLGSRLWLLQPFTADPRLLRAAIEAKSLKNSPLLENTARGDGSQSLSEQIQEVEGNNLTQTQVVQRLKQFEADHSSTASQLRARYTLEALNQIARYLGGMPGRKNLIWFSGSFPINVLPDSSLLGPFTDPFAPVAGSSDLFRQTTRLLAQSQVAVYPVGAGGLSTSSVYSVEESGMQYDTRTHPLDTFANNVNSASTENADNNITMQQMAEQTGGHAYINTNGLATAVTQSIAAGSNYYTLTYSPTDAVSDGKFRKIQLKLRRDGFTMAYRRGYYADAPPATSAPVEASRSAPNPAPGSPVTFTALKPAPPVVDAMHNAMIFGSPMPTQITLKVMVVPAAKKPEQTLLASNYAIASANISGPYQRYDVVIAADPSAIEFTPTADGGRHANLQFRTYVYTRDGKLINTSSRVREEDFTAALYNLALHKGLFLHQQISVPLKGEFYLRIGVHDVTADHDGVVEVPVDSVKDLPALAVPLLTPPLRRRSKEPSDESGVVNAEQPH
ncbi:VWFA-related protein [Granulicella aggregans]|uniref:VWFA-related protein n=1 Tax=Granulicella aggregans TaxID=474949 RepID=A0A7W7ZI27_9BACT|nr:VWA domain-containing protein [Granulicella aggregans]MBB5060278.1 VWFA-related protein [Granulicella aggregans]